MEKQSLPRLLVLVGPTASGKTALAIQLARVFHGEIISADSRYFYREMNIGTAKPTDAELQLAPHHLINVCSLSDDSWSLGLFQKHATALIENIHARGKLAILTGGTGQYIRAVLQNWDVPELQANPRLRAYINQWGERIGWQALHEKLAFYDPIAAATIDWRNTRRTVRALEVIFSTGKPFSSQRGPRDTAFTAFTLGLSWPRDLLYQRIDQRIDRMIADGLLEEVDSLVSLGYAENLKRMRVIGYTELLDYLDGKHSLEEAVALIRRNTRVYVRRQANWFKADDESIHWLNAQDPALLSNALGLVNGWLSS